MGEGLEVTVGAGEGLAARKEQPEKRMEDIMKIERRRIIFCLITICFSLSPQIP